MQADEGRLDAFLADVPNDVDTERVVAEAVAARTGLDAREVDAARRELLKEGQQSARFVDGQGHLDGRLVRAGGRGHRARTRNQHEARDRAWVIGHVLVEGLEAVGAHGHRVAQGSVEGGVTVGEELGGRRRRGRRHVDRAREGTLDPAAALRPRVRMRADAADVFSARARQDCELEDDVDMHFGDDHEGIAVREGVEGRVHAALDGVFDRDDSTISLATAHSRKRLRGARHRQEDGTGGRDLVDGLFGKSTEGAEERDAELVTKGRGAGNVRRHSVKGIDTRRRWVHSVPAQGRIVAYSSPDRCSSGSSAPGWVERIPSAKA